MAVRAIVAAFGDPGHALPALSLARTLKGRGNEVLLESWERWRSSAEEHDLGFRGAEEYSVYPPPAPDSGDGRTAARAARALVGLIEEFEPDIVVSDILTLAPALAAEVAGVPRATLVPHVYPVQIPGMPLYSTGMAPPRTPVGSLAWRATLPLVSIGLRRGRADLNSIRADLGLSPQQRFHGGLSERLTIVATFPQLEYPREWPAYAQVTGPLLYDMPHPEVALPAGEEPLVLVAPSTSQDPEGSLVRAALGGLAGRPVRVLAALSGQRPEPPIEAPDNATLVDWLPHSQAMEAADLVISHGGHGTVARALSEGVPVLVCPAGGDMAENGARVSWAGCGRMLPRRLLGPRALGDAAEALLADQSARQRAEGIAAWSRSHDGAEVAAEAVERAAGA